MTATPTGIPVTRCTTCERTHPETRAHCTVCNTASIFVADGLCLNCRENGR